MSTGQQRRTFQVWAGVALAAVAMAAWAAWLGWDQHRDVHPDGSTTGPYEAWQVVGLGLTLLAPVCWAAFRGYAVAGVVGTTAGLTVAAFYDWSDDASGLFVIGTILVMIGTLAVTSAVALLATALKRKGE
ncbi:hypothetical protein [Streptomyces gardneri]|uniref:hypothetical protein n=1 Tax=Streptomyces gardneri TaxID=66892 RepID=UPI001142C69B|nr:hypothetical protein [Streptomyces gardneri]